MSRKFKTDIHCHTKEGSYCASEDAESTIERYIEAGYSTIVITNHFSPFDYVKNGYHNFVDWHFDAYEKALEVARGRINVLSGSEIKIHQFRNDDFLAIGATREIMHSMDNFFNMSLSDIKKVLNDNNCLLIKAHPMRYGQTMFSPDEVDGYEIYNSNTYWARVNHVAKLWVDAVGCYNKAIVAGNDHHNRSDILRAGILTDVEIKTNDQLVEILKSNQFEAFY